MSPEINFIEFVMREHSKNIESGEKKISFVLVNNFFEYINNRKMNKSRSNR